MDVPNHVRAGDGQQLVVALHVVGKVGETVACAICALVAFTPVLGFTQLEALNHGAHGTIQNCNTLLQQGRQLLGTGVVGQAHSLRL